MKQLLTQEPTHECMDEVEELAMYAWLLHNDSKLKLKSFAKTVVNQAADSAISKSPAFVSLTEATE